ncbi:MAG: DUF4405 domain-containing protein [Lachnospiraceae bacterium]|nr:DUF4405 domain-containing protein [Lachnospiraceae bacterium]
MKPKMILKIAVDMAMTVSLLLLMAYELIGQAVHEWVGIGMFMLFVIHHILNRKWSRNLLKGKYTALRVMQTIFVILVLFCMLGSMVSGVILSRKAFSFLSIKAGQSWARTLHMLSAYWGFVFMSLHLGFHWNMMMGMVGKIVKSPSKIRKRILCTVAVLIAGYGIFAFIGRDIGSYMLLKNQFVFFDFEEQLLLFLLDYIAVMGLFVFIGHYLSEILKKLQKRKPTV